MYEVLEPWHTVFGVICMKHSVVHVSKVTVRNPSFMKVFHLILVLGIPSGYFPVWVRRRHEGLRGMFSLNLVTPIGRLNRKQHVSISCGPIHMDKQTIGPTTTYNIRNPMKPVGRRSPDSTGASNYPHPTTSIQFQGPSHYLVPIANGTHCVVSTLPIVPHRHQWPGDDKLQIWDGLHLQP